METIQGLKRSRYCGEFRMEHVGQKVTVFGWCQRQRDLGQLIFIDLRDRSGIVQLAFDEDSGKDAFEKAFRVRSEFVLAAVGLVTILSLLVGLVGNLIESTRKETEFERLIAPLVMLDPPSLDDPSQLSNQMLLQSSMWSVLLNTDTSQYAIDEYDRMTIPASDVDVQCAKLYGAQVHLEHMTFGGIESPFLYDAEGQRYYVPITGQSNNRKSVV